ncbi:PliI family lysozyme inhibitor of I-type lysozyme [Shewanella sp. 10N.261.52.F9]|uniref:PliI family lysozyme inhibitor of I-type lysozyme n=1 Tax=Shewanella sp. 10N.261.52.F9 TaxID=3229684 RepID=UPI00354E8E7C
MFRLAVVCIVIFVSGCSININKSKEKPIEGRVNNSDSVVADSIQDPKKSAGYLQTITLANGNSLIVEEGRLEPRSIGSASVKLYRDLNVGDFVAAVNFVRDGTILTTKLIENSRDKQKIAVTTVTAGSGNYQNTQLICITNNSIVLCE